MKSKISTLYQHYVQYTIQNDQAFKETDCNNNQEKIVNKREVENGTQK